MKVGFERRNIRIFTGKRPLAKFSCSFIVKLFPFFTAKRHGFCNRIILTKTTVRGSVVQILSNCSLQEHLTLSACGVPETTDLHV
jgi:hypothetical protein